MGTAGVTASAFAFTSLLTIPLFSPMSLYVIAIALAFFTAMALVVITDYRTPEQKAEALARIAKQAAEGGPHVDILAEEEAQDGFETPAEMDGITAAEAQPFAGVLAFDPAEAAEQGLVEFISEHGSVSLWRITGCD